MNSRFLTGVAAATLAAFIGSDSLIDSAQSLTIPSLCVDGEQCAALCRAHVEDRRDARGLHPARRLRTRRARRSRTAAGQSERCRRSSTRTTSIPRSRRASSARRRRARFRASTCPISSPARSTSSTPRRSRWSTAMSPFPSPQHIVPSWDLQTLWVSGDISYRGGHASVAAIDPKTGKMSKTIDLPDAYNMYFTPDGRSAIVVAEAMRRLEFRDPHTMALQGYIAAPRCAGDQPRRFLARRLLRDLHLRIRRHARQDRPRPSHARRHAAALARPHPAGHPHRARRLGLLRRRHAQGRADRHRRRHVQGDRLHPDRRRRARPLSQPRRQAALHLQSRHAQSRRRAATARAASR